MIKLKSNHSFTVERQLHCDAVRTRELGDELTDKVLNEFPLSPLPNARSCYAFGNRCCHRYISPALIVSMQDSIAQIEHGASEVGRRDVGVPDKPIVSKIVNRDSPILSFNHADVRQSRRR